MDLLQLLIQIQEIADYDINKPTLYPIRWISPYLEKTPTELILTRFEYLETRAPLINHQYKGRKLHPFYEMLNSERHLLEGEILRRGLDLKAILDRILRYN